MSVVEELRWRGLLSQMTHDELEPKLAKESVTVYAGFDPTADSLHIGSLLPIMGLVHFQRAGQKPIALICATGGRSGQLLRALKRAGYTGYIDVSEGMLGSPLGAGWIARGLAVVDLETALRAMPMELR